MPIEVLVLMRLASLLGEAADVVSPVPEVNPKPSLVVKSARDDSQVQRRSAFFYSY